MSTQYITSIGLFYKNVGFYLEVVWLWRISGGFSQEMMWVVIRSKKPSKHIQNCPSMTDECQYTFGTNYFMYWWAASHYGGLRLELLGRCDWLGLIDTYVCYHRAQKLIVWSSSTAFDSKTYTTWEDSFHVVGT